MKQPPFLIGERLILRALTPADASEDYLAWLNDPAVLRYRAPKAFPSGEGSLRAYLDSVPGRGDLHLAICLKDGGRHIGNLSLSSIQWVHGTAELSIMIGAQDLAGGGYGREAMALVTAHAFRSMGVRRLWAESPNPAFNRSMERLGWVKEGVKRQALLVDGDYADLTCWGLMKDEWRKGERQ